MTDRELKQLLCSMERPKADEAKKAASIKRILAQAGELRGVPRISHWERIFTMAGYLPVWLWLGQALLLVLCGFAAAMNGEVLELFPLLLPLLGCLACGEIPRGLSCRMWELEQSCRYNLREVILLKTQIIGGTDLVLLLCVIGMYAGRGVSLAWCMAKIAFPFVLAAAVYFWVLHHAGHRTSSYAVTAAGIFSALLADGIAGNLCSMLEKRYVGKEWAWIAVLLAAALLLLSLRRYLKNCDREEKQRWSFD